MKDKRFEFETVIKDTVNLCNMDKEKKAVMNLVLDGQKILLFGRRNTGKTSLVESFVIPQWLKKNKPGFYVQVDLYGVRSLTHISQRIALGFSEGFSVAFRAKSIFQSLIQLIASLRPRMTMDSEGKTRIELSTSEGKLPHFKDIFQKINEIHLNDIPALIVMDEFQDIAGIDEAEGLLRDSLQRLAATIPVIILGSKKHLLSKVFSVPKAPLYNWGESVEIAPIEYREYTDFMKERGLKIDLEVATYLQDCMKRIPEPINIVCYHLLKKAGTKKITLKMVDESINEIVQNRRGRPQEFISTLTYSQARFLEVMGRHGVIKKITAKQVQREARLTSPGILKIVAHFEDAGVMYKGDEGYEIADPFLELHIRKYGI